MMYQYGVVKQGFVGLLGVRWRKALLLLKANSYLSRLALVLLAYLALTGSSSTTPASASAPLDPARIAGLHIPFVAASDDRDAAFTARTFAGVVHATRDGTIVYDLPGTRIEEIPINGRTTQVIGEDRLATEVNIFHGNDPARWRRRIPAYARVNLGEIYPGVVVTLQARGDTVEKVFSVQPGADPGRIRLRIQGGHSLAVTSAGALEVRTARGPVHFSPPVAYQEDAGARQIVQVAYRVEGDEYGFQLGAYDRTRSLVIDPILAATYYGGFGADRVRAIVRDPSGDVFIAGYTHWGDLPGISLGAADPTGDFGIKNYRESFVARLDPGLTTVLAATFLGGTGDDTIYAMDQAPNGDIYVAGETAANDFPGVGGEAADDTFEGDSEIFVARMSPDLGNLIDATYLGGAQVESASAIQVDRQNKVYVAGATRSSDFPGIGSASADSTFAGFGEAVVVRLDASLSSIEASSFLGGLSAEGATALLRSPLNRVYVGGFTRSFNFAGIGSLGGPGGNGGIPAADATFGGDSEAFVVRLDLDLSAIQAATFLGGSNSFYTEVARGLAEDSSGDLFVTGETSSADFPGISPASADNVEWDGEAFVVKLNPVLGSILAATFLGGNTWDNAWAIDVDRAQRIWLTGGTRGSFPGPSPNGDMACGGGTSSSYAVWAAVLSNDLGTIEAVECVQAGKAYALALDDAGVYVAGVTSRFGNNTTIGPGVADDVTSADEGFVAHLDLGIPPALVVNFDVLRRGILRLSVIAQRVLQQSFDRAYRMAQLNRDRAALAALRQFAEATRLLLRQGVLSDDEAADLLESLGDLVQGLENSPDPLPVAGGGTRPGLELPREWQGGRPFQWETPNDHPLRRFDVPVGLRSPPGTGVVGGEPTL